MSFITENLSYFFCSNCIFWSNQTPHLFLQMTWHYRVDRDTDLATQWTLLHYIRGRDWKGKECGWHLACKLSTFPQWPGHVCSLHFTCAAFHFFPVSKRFSQTCRCLLQLTPTLCSWLFPPKTFPHCLILAFRYL